MLFRSGKRRVQEAFVCLENMGSLMPAFKTVVLIETAIVVLFVTYTYARFMMVISGGKK